MSRKPPVEDRPIDIALVGCGRVGQHHVRAIQQYADDYKLVALVDEYTPAADKLAQGNGHVQTFTDIEAMAEQLQPDVVVLATPSGLHAPQAISAAKAGCHVVSEKPLATTVQDGLAMIRAADKHGVQLFVVKQNRYNAPIVALKDAIDQGRFGQIYMANFNVFWCRPQAYYDQAAWRGTWEFDGGALMNQACHYADMLTWLLGPVQSIQAMGGTLARDIQAEDTIALNCRWRRGTIGSLNVTTLTQGSDFEGSVTLIGEKGTVRVGGIAMNKILNWQFADKLPADDSIQSLNYEIDSVYGFGHQTFYQRLIPVLRGKAQPDVSGRDAYKTLEVIIGAYLSARDGATVALPLPL